MGVFQVLSVGPTKVATGLYLKRSIFTYSTATFHPILSLEGCVIFLMSRISRTHLHGENKSANNVLLDSDAF